ncbi:FAD/NAD(P)-binding protein [Azospirillum sp.]|uniref:FAD/NAD(P)-binding protein n=1 Tax=Azospirillum sp. TaxID=34012 RepID=UPI002D75D1F1|nr:FAD/NAD(P)-binding protein [Azospirillum sp.]HYD66985.1 FAD/NAD(P)-binding protein [Azospirillum sp.]
MNAPAVPWRVAIVGAGFTGSLLAVHLMRAAATPVEIHLIERRPVPGPGLAYSTGDDSHLLNVRAHNMSAFPEDPPHFQRWLWSLRGSAAGPSSGNAFASRTTYGAYIVDVLEQARRAAPPHVALHVHNAEVHGIVPTAAGVRLTLDGADTGTEVLDADAAVLCTGHFPPSPPAMASAEAYDSPHYIGDPWNHAAIAGIDADAPVVILGTGLTMVDTVLTLDGNGHRGPIVALSRNGRLPHVHEETRPFASAIDPAALPSTVRGLLAALRADAARAEAEGAGWRSAFDALRPHHHRLWQALDESERRRFLRHGRGLWDVHRHRMAPRVAARIESLREAGRLEVRSGRLLGLVAAERGLRITVAPRSGEAPWSLVGTLINSTGPQCDYARIRHPLVRALLGQGLARPDPLRLGLDVTADGALVGADGRPSDRLFAVGPLARAPYWEMLAVPELRTRCAEAGRELAERAERAARGRPR